jgi:hypothetical protein
MFLSLFISMCTSLILSYFFQISIVVKNVVQCQHGEQNDNFIRYVWSPELIETYRKITSIKRFMS